MRKISSIYGELGEGGCVGYLFDRAELEEKIGCNIEDLDDDQAVEVVEAVYGIDLTEHFSGAGQFYKECPFVIASPFRVLIRQYWGYDI